MRFRPLFVLGLLLGAEAAQVVRRQDTSENNSPSTETTGDDDSDSSTSAPAATATSTSNAGVTTSANQVTSTSAEGDTTVTRTTTVNADGDGVTRTTTVMATVTSTVVVTETKFTTITVTSHDADTATKTVYETSTSWANEKRAINLAPRTVGPEYFQVDAEATAVPTITQINWSDLELLRPRLRRHAGEKHQLQKRATITRVVTVTASGGASTIVNTVSRTVISTSSSKTTITNTVTETEQADASTTVTVTSTLTVVSTSVSTGVVVTATAAESGNYGSAGTGVPTSSASSSNDSGLSTGAKAGIGVGAGIGGLLIVGLIAWMILRRRSRGPKPDPDDMFGASEVPVGGPVSGNTPPMSQHSTSAAAAGGYVAPSRNPSKPTTSPEGYRGTAMGDGRAGYAKPMPFGSSYTPKSPDTAYSRTTGSGADYLPEHPSPLDMSPNTAELGSDGTAARWHQADAAEMDSTSAHPPHQPSPPPQNVFEMPAQAYR